MIQKTILLFTQYWQGLKYLIFFEKSKSFTCYNLDNVLLYSPYMLTTHLYDIDSNIVK